MPSAQSRCSGSFSESSLSNVCILKPTSMKLTNMKLHPVILTFFTTITLRSWAMAADPTTPSVPADEALSRLKAGNERFAQSKVSAGQPVAARRAATAQTQIRLPSSSDARIRGLLPKSSSIKASGTSLSFAPPEIWSMIMLWGASIRGGTSRLPTHRCAWA